LLSKEEGGKNRFQKKETLFLSLSSENSFHKVRNKRPFREKIWVAKEGNIKKKNERKIILSLFSFCLSLL